MNTSALLIALASFAVSADVEKAPSWEGDYAVARKQGESEKKPLAVFLGAGQTGWAKVGRGGLNSEVNRILASRYVCVHVDTATDAGKQLARAFEMPGGLGIVISDGSGQQQAFRHEGDLANTDLARYLQRFEDPNRVVRTTESNPGSLSTSYYQAPGYVAPAQTYTSGYYGQPYFGGGFAPSFGGFGGCAGGH